MYQCLQLDGWIARNFKSQASKIGSFLDPMADKILIATLFLSLTYMDLIPGKYTVLTEPYCKNGTIFYYMFDL